MKVHKSETRYSFLCSSPTSSLQPTKKKYK